MSQPTLAALSVSEDAELAECEVIIERGEKTFIEVAIALRRIHDKKLYRKSYKTFDAYCKGRWGWGRQSAYQRIAAAQVIQNVNPDLQSELSQSQAFQLKQLQPQQQEKVIKALKNTGGLNSIRKNDVKAVARAVKAGAEPEEAVLSVRAEKVPSGALVDRFLEPPFSVLDARQVRWQDRKRGWLDLGIQSELGRDAEALKIGSKKKWDKSKKSPTQQPDEGEAGTSVFDPVLCELMYTWFCPPKGLILDPFAGGSVRGIIASLLDRRYVGVDLSEFQLKVNREQATRICKGHTLPRWLRGNSITQSPEVEADFLFSSPPYWNLERYSDSPGDLSTMSWLGFVEFYRKAVHHAALRLKPHRFACFVVGAIRDKKTTELLDLPGITIQAFADAGMKLYNDSIFVTPVGSLAIRSGKFDTTRKLGNTHQRCLVFVKGDWKRAVKAAGPIKVIELPFH